MRKRGLALIVMLGILGVLGILATCFITLSHLERQASQRRIHQTRALFLARSGIEDALARLDAGQHAAAAGNAYHGEDWDGNDELSVFEAEQEVFRRTGAGTPADTQACPIVQAMRPTFFVRVPGSDNPETRLVDGRQRGFSGALSTDGELTYALKVEDESGKININGGFLDAADRDADGIEDCRDPDVRFTTAVSDNGLGWNYQLCRILNVLGAEPELGMPASFGMDVLTRRPQGGYGSVVQLQSLIGTTTDLSPYLTNLSWVDRKVVQPNGWGAGGLSLNEIKKLRAPLALDPSGRPPVNLNTASQPVLRALLRGVRAFYAINVLNFPFFMELSPSDPGGPAVVDSFVARLLARRASSPFLDWADFSSFCDDALPTMVSGLAGLNSTYVARRIFLPDLVKANFDPNTSLNKDLPDQIKFRFMDKADLKVWSTEGCFEPTGTFRIGGLGRVLGSDGKLLAEHSLAVVVRLYDLLRQTTQKDFLAGRRLEECHSISSMGGVLRTTGAGAAWPDWSGSGQGLSTLSYPNPPTVRSVDAADFDGYLGLATVEAVGGEVPAGGALMFLHHLDDSWTADSGVAPARVTPGPSDGMLTAPLTCSVWPATGLEPNTLRPDGLHIQRDRCPAFLATNMPASTSSGVNGYNHGVVGLWVKPAASSSFAFDFSSVKGGDPTTTQVLLIGRSSNSWGMIVENHMIQNSASDPERQAVMGTSDIPMRLPMLRWTLETAFFDTRKMVSGQDLRFDLHSVYPPATKDPTDPPYPPFDAASSLDLFAYDTTPGTDAMIVLGNPGKRIAYTPNSNSVIDEVCVCDFTDQAPDAQARMALWIGERFRDGRYYKENDARFLSTHLSLGDGPSRLLWARWTCYLPREDRKEIGGAAVSRFLDERLRNSTVELELLDSAGSFSSTPLQGLVQGGRIGRTLDGFRYRATFKPNLADLSDPVLESPFLDDVTFAWQPASGPRVLAWGER